MATCDFLQFFFFYFYAIFWHSLFFHLFSSLVFHLIHCLSPVSLNNKEHRLASSGLPH